MDNFQVSIHSENQSTIKSSNGSLAGHPLQVYHKHDANPARVAPLSLSFLLLGCTPGSAANTTKDANL